jgi:hypothetical protein
VIPYLDERILYDIKDSKYRQEFLQSLVLNGKLSVSKYVALTTEKRDYKNAFTACSYLIENKLIAEKYKDNKAHGRPEIYYRITELGMYAILAVDPTPKKFWSLILAFCYHRHTQITLNQVNDFYLSFLSKYLKYPTCMDYLSLLEPVNKMCLNWINSNVNNKHVSLSQRVIEVLSIYPQITLKELARRVGNESEEQIKSILDQYDMTQIHYTDLYYISDEDYYERLPEQYLDFLKHCIINVHRNYATGLQTYELSLFGIILVMMLIRNRDRDQTACMFQKELSLPEYYDKVASNYEDKLPLIFGKNHWNLLKKHLKDMSVYNFDIVLCDEKTRSNAENLPVFMEGSKEFYQNMLSLTLYNSKQVNEIFDIGLSEFNRYVYENRDRSLSKEEYPEEKDDSYIQKVNPVYKKLQQIHLSLKYRDPMMFQDEIVQEEYKKYVKSALTLPATDASVPNNISALDVIEKAFAKEITFLYYLSLYREVYIPMIFPNKGFDNIMHELLLETVKRISPQKSGNMQLPHVWSLRERLQRILLHDTELKDWFCSSMKEIIEYQNQAAKEMNKSLSFCIES